MRPDALYLADAVTAIRQLQTFMAGLSEVEFLADPLKQSYVFHRLVIVGEAAVSLRRTFEARYPEVPWAQLSGCATVWCTPTLK